MMSVDLRVGGIQRLAVDLSNSLADAGVEVVLLVEHTGRLVEEVSPSVRVVVSGPLHRPQSLLGLRRLLLRWRPTLVHVHQRRSALFAEVAGAGLHLNLIEHVHNTFEVNWLSKQLSFRAPYLIACGTAVQRMLVEEFGKPPHQVFLAVNGVRDNGSEPRTELKAPSVPSITVLGVGRMVDEKDPLRFVRVVHALSTLTDGVASVWAGDGELHEATRAEAVRLGIGDILTLPGDVRDLGEWFDKSDVLLSTSKREGLPLVALEALSRGVPVVAPEVGSFEDLFNASLPVGFAYHPSARDLEVAARLLFARSNGEWQVWHSNARDVYVAEFTLERLIRDVESVYREVVRVARVSRAGRRRRS
jgi:glycosyltransferase involved in cell wall biosynthesis